MDGQRRVPGLVGTGPTPKYATSKLYDQFMVSQRYIVCVYL